MNIGLTFEHYSSKRSHIEKIKRGDYNKVNQGRREKKMEAVLAIDLGATSGRAIVGYLSENKLVMEEINRFSNLPIRVKGIYLGILTFY